MPAAPAPGSAGYQGTRGWWQETALKIQEFITQVGAIIVSSLTTTNFTIAQATAQVGGNPSIRITGTGVLPSIELVPPNNEQAQLTIFYDDTISATQYGYILSSSTGAAFGSDATGAATPGSLYLLTQSKTWTFADSGSLTLPGPLIFNAASVFQSAEITGNGMAQATAHSLGRTPVIAIAYFTAPTGGADTISAVTSDGTNCTVTATNTAKYRILAM